MKEDRSPDTNTQTDKPTMQNLIRPNAVIAAGKLVLTQKTPLKRKANTKLSQAKQNNKINSYFKVGTGNTGPSARGLVDLNIKRDPSTETRPRPTPKGQEQTRPDIQPQED